LRVAINTGACIAVRLNAKLDYFGNAVNLAARLQGLVEAGQIVVAASTASTPAVAATIAARGAERLAVGSAASPAGHAHRWTIA
jgi:class 3 adenylate cyclase